MALSAADAGVDGLVIGAGKEHELAIAGAEIALGRNLGGGLRVEDAYLVSRL